MENLVYSIKEDFVKYLQEKTRGRTLQNNLRASTIGFNCDRYHYYTLTEYRDPPSPELQAIFDEGNLHEKDIERKLRDMGYEVNDAQKEFRLEDPLITMHIDGMLRKGDGPWYPYDAKSVNPWDFDKLNSAEDFIYSKKPHQRNYVAQILLYMLVTNSEFGCLILKNKQTGQIKDIWFTLDDSAFEYCDNLIKRAQRVYEAHKKKEPPKRTKDLDLCLKCEWRGICLPDLKYGEGVSVVDNEHLEGLIARRAELEEQAKEYKKLDDEIKSYFKKLGDGERIVGKFLVRTKTRIQKVQKKVPVPNEYDERRVVTTKIVPLDNE